MRGLAIGNFSVERYFSSIKVSRYVQYCTDSELPKKCSITSTKRIYGNHTSSCEFCRDYYR